MRAGQRIAAAAVVCAAACAVVAPLRWSAPALASEPSRLPSLPTEPLRWNATGGQPAPSQPLLRVLAPVMVDMGGTLIEPFFAGLAPGWAGLYQVNFRVPDRLAPGGYPLALHCAQAASSPVSVPLAAGG